MIPVLVYYGPSALVTYSRRDLLLLCKEDFIVLLPGYAHLYLIDLILQGAIPNFPLCLICMNTLLHSGWSFVTIFVLRYAIFCPPLADSPHISE